MSIENKEVFYNMHYFYQVFSCYYQGAWKVHGCYCCWHREDGKRLYSIHERTGIFDFDVWSQCLRKVSIKKCRKYLAIRKI